MFSFLFKLLILILCLALLFGIWRTWKMEHSPNQTLYVRGTAPTPPPDGFYRGSVGEHKISWLGKRFNASEKSGINVFDDGKGIHKERYPFKTAYTKGLTDKDLNVLAIDYNIPENPFWLRPVLDEVVQIAPHEYLGKLHLRLIPGYPFTLGYFKLTK